MVIAGETSGDAHAGRMLAQLKKRAPDMDIFGVGGAQMRAAGAEIIIDFSELAVMGIVEVAKRYGHIKAIFRELVHQMERRHPDMLILVDYPGLNLKLAKHAKRLGITVFYYISPKIWAWRSGRIRTIKKYVDFMAVLFPFEVPIYQQAGVPVVCVGHPLQDAVKSGQTKAQARKKLGLAYSQTIIGLFPGSRQSEVRPLLPVMLDAAARLYAHNKDLQFVLPLAPGLEKSLIMQELEDRNVPVTVLTEEFYSVITACDAIVAASGTVTLEIALLGVPHCLIYKLSPLSYQVLKRLVRIPYVGLCNIVTGQPLIRELLQEHASPQGVEQTLIELLTPDSQQQAVVIQQQIQQALGPAGASANCAEQVLALLEKQ